MLARELSAGYAAAALMKQAMKWSSKQEPPDEHRSRPLRMFKHTRRDDDQGSLSPVLSDVFSPRSPSRKTFDDSATLVEDVKQGWLNKAVGGSSDSPDWRLHRAVLRDATLLLFRPDIGVRAFDYDPVVTSMPTTCYLSVVLFMF